jgi:hypothetical protein
VIDSRHRFGMIAAVVLRLLYPLMSPDLLLHR